jgi:hypothetical protein
MQCQPCTLRRLTAAAAALLLGLLVAACGSSAGGSSAAASSSLATQTVTTTVAQSSSSTTTSTGAASTTAGTTGATGATSRPCVAADLVLSFLGQQGATGHGLLGFTLKNTSDAPCHTFGYPGIQFLDRAGQPLPTRPTHTTRDFFGSAPEVALTLAPGQSASFRLGVTHGATSPQDCTTAYALQVIPPDDTATLRTAIPDGTYECATASVSPLRPGTSAYP